MTNPFNEAKSDHESESAPDIESELAALRQRAELAELEAMRQRAELAEQKLALLEQQGEPKKRGRISRAFRFSAKVWLGWFFMHLLITLFVFALAVLAVVTFGTKATEKFDQVNIEIGGDDPVSTTSTTKPCPEGASPVVCTLWGVDPQGWPGELIETGGRLGEEEMNARIQEVLEKEALETGECHLIASELVRWACESTEG